MEPHPLPCEIRTERLVLTCVRLDDAADQVAAIGHSLPELRAWMPWAHEPTDEQKARVNLAEGIAQFESGRDFNYVIRRADDGAFVGRTGVHRLGWSVPKGEIGYWQDTRMTGHGYVREAVAALVETLWREGFRRVEIRCDADNARSARIPEALGFTLDARLVHDDVAADDPSRLRDTLVFSLTR